MPAVVTQRSTEAVLPLDEIKKYCRIDADLTDDDAVLKLIERAAVASAEAKIGGPLLTAQCLDTLDAWPNLPWLHLGIAGGREVTDVRVIRDGQEVIVPLVDLHIEPDGRQLCVKPRGGWPKCDATPGAVRITYLAGFGDSVESLPDDLRQWLRFRAATMYEYREQLVTGTIVTDLPNRFVDALLDVYTVRGVVL